MGPLREATELSKAFMEAGNNLLTLTNSSTDVTLCLLDIIQSLLATFEQNSTLSLQNVLLPTMKALVSSELLRNPNYDVRVSVVACLTEIMRITAQNAPFNDDQLKEIFQVTVEAFGKLAEKENQDDSPTAMTLDENVLHSCAHKLQPYSMDALKPTGTNLDMYSRLVSSTCKEEEWMKEVILSMCEERWMVALEEEEEEELMKAEEMVEIIDLFNI